MFAALRKTEPLASPEEIREALRGVPELASLEEDAFLILASRAGMQEFSRGKTLFRGGSDDEELHCLIEGEVKLQAEDGRSFEVRVGEGQPGKILGRLKPRQHTATSLTSLRVIVIDTEGLGDWQASAAPASFTVEEFDEEGPAGLPGIEVTEEAEEDVDEGPELSVDEMQLPSLPSIALQAKQSIDRGDADAKALGTMVVNDPAIAAKLVKAANSALFMGAGQVSSCERAIVRLGLNTTRQLILTFAMGELFESPSPVLKPIATQLWEHSTEVAALASVVAKRTRTFDPGEAQLAGLLHDIGAIPVLYHAARSPALAQDPEVVEGLIKRQSAQMGTAVLENWNFPQAIVTAAADAENWWRAGSEAVELADVVMVAQLMSYLGKPAFKEAPPIVRLPAFSKVFGRGFDTEAMLELLSEADSEIAEIKSLLTG